MDSPKYPAERAAKLRDMVAVERWGDNFEPFPLDPFHDRIGAARDRVVFGEMENGRHGDQPGHPAEDRNLFTCLCRVVLIEPEQNRPVVVGEADPQVGVREAPRGVGKIRDPGAWKGRLHEIADGLGIQMLFGRSPGPTNSHFRCEVL